MHKRSSGAQQIGNSQRFQNHCPEAETAEDLQYQNGKEGHCSFSNESMGDSISLN